MINIENIVIDAISNVLEISNDSISISSGIDKTKNWDSLTNMDILLKVEDVLNIRFEASDLGELNSTITIVNKVRSIICQ